MNYPQAIQFLYDLQLFGFKLGLENTRRLAALAGNPQDRLRFIHVSGTNGKGSTCAMLESVYRASGLRVGLFTSPHLVSFGERIQVDRRPLGEAGVVEGVTGMQDLLKAFPPDHSPTFFEVVTVMALCHFARQDCDLVIWETGMGGRLDATNIVTPLATVITNVSLDHEKWLGHTLTQIATEKAGIIKAAVPALTAAEEPEALAVIRQTAGRLKAPLVEIVSAAADEPPLVGLKLPLLGRHQRLNAALAVATVRTLADQLAVPEEALRRGLESVRWAGRLQVIPRPGGGIDLVDGAHNPAGVAALIAALRDDFAGRPPVMILGVLQDKDWAAMGNALFPLAKSVCLVPVASARTATPEELRAVCGARHPHIPVNLCHSLAEALRLTHDEPFRLLTGSLYLVGEALELLDTSPASAAAERGLNEWQGRELSLPAESQSQSGLDGASRSLTPAGAPGRTPV